MEGADISVMDDRIILLADDTRSVLEQAERAAGDKYHIVTVKSGAEVMKYARENKPDLIIVDISMPEMDGFTCLKRLKADSKTKHIPVMISATDISPVTEVKGFSLGAADFIRKPFTEEIMTVRIETQFKLLEYEKMKKETEEERTT